MTDGAYNKPLPVADPVTKPFWDSLNAKQMQIQFSPNANKWVFYPRMVCPYTGSRELEWRPVSGKGTLYAFTVNYIARNPGGGFGADVPYVVALVDLDEGCRMMSTLVGVDAKDPASIKIGSKVEVVYDQVTDEVTLPRFKLS